MSPNKIRLALTGAIAAATTVVLISPPLASAAPAQVEQPGSVGRSSEVSDEISRALQRDLGLSPEQVTWQLAAQKAARQLNTELASSLGDDFAGSWYDQKSGKLVVAVSSAKRSAEVRDAGAKPVVVANSMASLEAVERELDTLAVTDSAAMTGITSWRIDPQRNAVVVTVQKGKARAAVLSELGQSVQVEESDIVPTVAQEWLDGGNAYNGCSVGFNAFDGAGTRHFVTAGHCGNVGDATSANGVNIGPFVASRFPGKDYAAVRVDNTAHWLQGPYVNAYDGAGGVYIVDNWFTDRAPEDTFVCKSGRTTGVTCGEVTASAVNVTYVDSNGNPIGTVNDLTQHNACVEPGDSGGSNLSNFTAEGHAIAEGLTSGAVMPEGRCLQVFGEENVSWYQPVFEALDEYGLTLYRF